MTNGRIAAIFAGGVLLGTAGLKLLTSRDAKKVYTHATAAALRAKESMMTSVTRVQEAAGDILDRAKDCVMKAATTVREGAEDIYADAKDINEARARAEAGETVENTAAEA